MLLTQMLQNNQWRLGWTMLKKTGFLLSAIMLIAFSFLFLLRPNPAANAPLIQLNSGPGQPSAQAIIANTELAALNVQSSGPTSS